MENKNKNYGFYYQYLCGDVVAILDDENGKQVACHSDYNGGWIGDKKVNYDEFKKFVEDATGKTIQWEWDELYQAYFPYLEAV